MTLTLNSSRGRRWLGIIAFRELSEVNTEIRAGYGTARIAASHEKSKSADQTEPLRKPI